MHHSVPGSQMGLLPSMHPFCATSSPLEFDLGPQIVPPHPHKRDFSTVSSAKRRRLTPTEGELWNNLALHSLVDGLGGHGCSAVTPLPAPSAALSLPCPVSVPAHTPPAQSSCMEVEAAQRRLREIEERITLEDDSDSDLDLEVEGYPRKPVLVLSDSLKEGLQRGLSDILPHTVAQSVSHSCMELVLWRPPDDPFIHCLKDPAHKPCKLQSGPRQPPTPCPSPSPHTDSPLPLFRVPSSVDEEDMEI